jgi:hypothetical protein
LGVGRLFGGVVGGGVILYLYSDFLAVYERLWDGSNNARNVRWAMITRCTATAVIIHYNPCSISQIQGPDIETPAGG